MIHVSNLSYSYTRDGRYAVNDISFDIQKGEIFGFLGAFWRRQIHHAEYPHGAFAAAKGATPWWTDMICTRRIKKRFNHIGMSFEQSNLYSKLTAEEKPALLRDAL